MQIPLPDIRTVQRRMQHVKLKPAVLGEVFDMLKLKVSEAGHRCLTGTMAEELARDFINPRQEMWLPQQKVQESSRNNKKMDTLKYEKIIKNCIQ